MAMPSVQHSAEKITASATRDSDLHNALLLLSISMCFIENMFKPNPVMMKDSLYQCRTLIIFTPDTDHASKLFTRQAYCLGTQKYCLETGTMSPRNPRSSSAWPVRRSGPTSVVDTTQAVAQLAQVEVTAGEAMQIFGRLQQQTRSLRRSLGGDVDVEMSDDTITPSPPRPRYPSRSTRIRSLYRVQSGRVQRPYTGRPRSEIYNYRELLSPRERSPPRTRTRMTHRLSPVREDEDDDEYQNFVDTVPQILYPYNAPYSSPDDRIDPRTGFAVPPPWVRFKYDQDGRVVFRGMREDWEGLEDFLPPHPWGGEGGRFGNVVWARDGRPCRSTAEEAPMAPSARRVETPDWALERGHG